jgi:hypothetical protein
MLHNAEAALWAQPSICCHVPHSSSLLTANPQTTVGSIWGGLCILLPLYSSFCVRGLKGRSLEEISEMFEAKLWAGHFNRYKTTGLGARLAAHEADK